MSISIISPTDNSSLPPSFNVYGQVSQVCTVSAKLSRAGQQDIEGTSVQQPNSMNLGYDISFSNVPVGTGYSLTVTDSADRVGKSENLTVHA